MCLFKARKLQKELDETRNKLMEYQNAYMTTQAELGKYQHILNKLVFDNEITGPKKGWASLDGNLVVNNPDNPDEQQETNANIVQVDDNNYYMFLSKKLTEGYSYVSINFVCGQIWFYLNNDEVGLKIDSNNRVYGNKILSFIMAYMEAKDKKIEFFLTKNDINC